MYRNFQRVFLVILCYPLVEGALSTTGKSLASSNSSHSDYHDSNSTSQQTPESSIAGAEKYNESSEFGTSL